ncbi:unnamed protein product [Bemisia tabaci]|uniref:Uncharacterized protein n=1 Tax=Bemisia tabaci TaxID=7038 RepID=A0A9P0A7E7_BEMTA|nr:unnamed protein product [Bemisia tabaci]
MVDRVRVLICLPIIEHESVSDGFNNSGCVHSEDNSAYLKEVSVLPSVRTRRHPIRFFRVLSPSFSTPRILVNNRGEGYHPASESCPDVLVFRRSSRIPPDARRPPLRQRPPIPLTAHSARACSSLGWSEAPGSVQSRPAPSCLDICGTRDVARAQRMLLDKMNCRLCDLMSHGLHHSPVAPPTPTPTPTPRSESPASVSSSVSSVPLGDFGIGSLSAAGSLLHLRELLINASLYSAEIEMSKNVHRPYPTRINHVFLARQVCGHSSSREPVLKCTLDNDVNERSLDHASRRCDVESHSAARRCRSSASSSFSRVVVVGVGRCSVPCCHVYIVSSSSPVAQWIESIGEVGRNLETLNACNSLFTKLREPQLSGEFRISLRDPNRANQISVQYNKNFSKNYFSAGNASACRDSEENSPGATFHVNCEYDIFVTILAPETEEKYDIDSNAFPVDALGQKVGNATNGITFGSYVIDNVNGGNVILAIARESELHIYH